MATDNERDECQASPIRGNLIARMTDIQELLANENYIEAVSTQFHDINYGCSNKLTHNVVSLCRLHNIAQ